MVYYEKEETKEKSKNYFVINKRLSIKASRGRSERSEGKTTRNRKKIFKSL